MTMHQNLKQLLLSRMIYHFRRDMVDIIKDLSNEDYHARPEISKSSLDMIHKSMDHFHAPRKPPTPKMEFGTAFHTLILEPKKFDKQYMSGSNLDGRTTEGKAENKKLKEEAEETGKKVLKHDDYENLMRMKEKTEKHPRFSSYFEQGEPEVSVFWEMQGVGCKCRPDWMINGGDYIIDLKTANDASVEGFSRSIANFRYHVQDAWYTKGVQVATRKSPTFVFIVVENVLPFSIAIYVLDAPSKDEGWQVADNDLRKYVNYQEMPEEERYAGYSPDAVEISLPRWGFKETYY